MLYLDYHLHTYYSDDFDYPMEQLIKDAISKGLSDLTPSKEILKLYKSLGGTIITIGNDTHKPEHLAAYIKETLEELKEMGFISICTFQDMKPIFHKL